jgi:hypothetical protein
MLRPSSFTVLLVFAVAACSGSNGSPVPPATPDDGSGAGAPGATGGGMDGSGGSGGTGTGTKPAPAGDLGPPVIVSLTTDKTTVGPAETIHFTAVVTDPDGPADIAGGGIYPAPAGSSAASSLTFSRDSSSGPFAAIGTIAAFHAMSPLTLAPAETTTRGYVARFSDRAGNVAEKAISLTFSGGDKGICKGAVVASFFVDCTSCATSCGSGTSCIGNACAARLDCGFSSFSCSSRCSDAGKKCLGVSPAFAYATMDDIPAALSSCDASPRAAFAFGAAACAATSASAVQTCFCQ